jgi:hypothetical protein
MTPAGRPKLTPIAALVKDINIGRLITPSRPINLQTMLKFLTQQNHLPGNNSFAGLKLIEVYSG